MQQLNVKSKLLSLLNIKEQRMGNLGEMVKKYLLPGLYRDNVIILGNASFYRKNFMS